MNADDVPLREYLDQRIEDLSIAITGRFSSLEKHIDERFDERERAFTASLVNSREAVEKADHALEKRFDGVNEFRATLSDQQARLMTRKEYAAAHGNLTQRVNDLQDRMNLSEGKSDGYSALYGWLIGGIGVLVAVVLLANTFLSK